MLKETADELRLTPYVPTFFAPPSYIHPTFYFNLEHDNDPPIYQKLLDEMEAKNAEQSTS